MGLFSKIFKSVVPIAAGILTGNPAIGAAVGAGIGASGGGGIKGAFLGGVGGYYGSVGGIAATSAVSSAATSAYGPVVSNPLTLAKIGAQSASKALSGVGGSISTLSSVSSLLGSSTPEIKAAGGDSANGADKISANAAAEAELEGKKRRGFSSNILTTPLGLSGKPGQSAADVLLG